MEQEATTQQRTGSAVRPRPGSRIPAALLGLVLVAALAIPASPAAASTEAPAPAPAASPVPTPDVVPGPGDAPSLPEGPADLVLVEQSGDELEITTTPVADAADAFSQVRDAAADGDLVSYELDTPVAAMASPDPLRHQQWALDRVAFGTAWSRSRGAGVKVAVIDSGVRASHEDFGSVVLAGRDYVGSSDGRTDPNGHGTHVAGVIAARPSNGKGITGAAPDVRILPIRVLDSDGAGYSSDVAKGIKWAADHGADVINLSLGGTTASSAVRSALQYAQSKGVVVLAAAGNSAATGNPVIYPAAFPETIAVGAVDAASKRASFSSHHPYVDLVAPGVSIISTWKSSNSSYAWASGTSMATPYATAAAAIVVASNRSLSPQQVRSRLLGTARDLGTPGRDRYYGNGLIDPDRASRTPAPAPTGGSGYWVVGADGRVQAHGGAVHRGDLRSHRLSARIVASAATPTGRGYWLVGANGAVYTFGDAAYHGGMTNHRLNSPIVGMAPTPTGRGYLLLGRDGGIFTFGDARFFGSTGGMRLNAPVLDMRITPSGNGYWMVGADGGIFTFGDARFRGSTGGMRLNQPVVSMTASARGQSYWLVARDGGMFTFGVPFHGSLPGAGVNSRDAVRIRALGDGSGYYVLTRAGGVYTFGNARFFGASAPLPFGGGAVDLMLA